MAKVTKNIICEVADCIISADKYQYILHDNIKGDTFYFHTFSGLILELREMGMRNYLLKNADTRTFEEAIKNAIKFSKDFEELIKPLRDFELKELLNDK